MTYKELLKEFEQLSGVEQEKALKAMELMRERESGLLRTLSKEVRESRAGSMPCPYCQSVATIHRGKQKEVEKYSCKDCGKHFRSSHGSALYRIQRKDKWQSYLRLMEQGYSIKAAARELGISIQTSFTWRHKILASLQSTLPTQLGGVVECDDFQLAESFKGQRKMDREARKRGSDSKKHHAAKVSVITAVSRSKAGGMAKVVMAKKISGKEAQIALDQKLAPDTVFITDEAAAYNAVAKNNPTIVHKKRNSKENRTRKPTDNIHLQTVNNQHKQIKDFLTPFNGVATKYLPNYLNWFFYQQTQKNNNSKITTMLLACLTAANALKWVAQIINNEILIRT